MTENRAQTSSNITTPPLVYSESCPECGADCPLVCGLCLDCMDRRIVRHNREQRRAALRSRWGGLVDRGLVRREARGCSWRASSTAIEGMNPAAWAAGRKWRLGGEKNLFLFGALGVGKTYLARACLLEAFIADQTVAEVAAPELCRVAWGFQDRLGLLDAWKQAGVLLIDDLDKVGWNVARCSAFWEVMDARTAPRRRTIIASNLDPAALVKLLVDACPSNPSIALAAFDRLKPCLKLEFTGPSLRGRDDL